VGKLQEKFGIAKEDARVEIEEFKTRIDNLKKSNAHLMKLQKASKKTVKKSNGTSAKAKAGLKRIAI
jgi:hypothetical protein